MVISPSNRSGVAAWDGVAMAIPMASSLRPEYLLETDYVSIASIDFDTYPQ